MGTEYMWSMILSSVSALALSALSAYLLVKRGRTAPSRMLSAALLLLACMELSDGLSLLPSVNALFLRQFSQIVESLAPGLFLFSVLTYARSTALSELSLFRIAMTAALALLPPLLLAAAAGDLSYSPDLRNEAVLFLGYGGYWFYFAIMTTYITSLVRLETTFSATRGTDRYRFKYEAIGIMSMFAVMIFYYSQGLLYRTIDLNLLPVRSGVFVIAALMVGYSAAVRGNGVRVSVSRYLFYRSIALIVVGVYLTALGVFQEGVNYFGGDFGRHLTVFLAFTGGIALLLVFLSVKVRRWVKVSVSKHFFAQKYDYRDEWMKFTARLAPCRSLADVQDAVVSAFYQTFSLEGASLYLSCRDGDRFLYVAERGMRDCPTEARISDSLRGYFIDRNRVWNPFDREHDSRPEERVFAEQAGAALIVPLISRDRIEGLLVIGKQTISYEYTYEDFDLMKSLGRQAAFALSNSRLSEELMEGREMAVVARISSFVIHDLKNLTSNLSLVVDNAGEHIGNTEFQKDAIATMRGTLEKMKLLTQRLRAVPGKQELRIRREDMDALARETVEAFARARSEPRLMYNGIPALSLVDGEEIRNVLTNLMQNAVEASDGQGAVIVETARENGEVRIRVSDAGCGMSEEYLNNYLFKPFRTTKKKGLGIGLYQSRHIVESHGGRIEVASESGKGTVFTVCLPAAADI